MNTNPVRFTSSRDKRAAFMKKAREGTTEVLRTRDVLLGNIAKSIIDINSTAGKRSEVKCCTNDDDPNYKEIMSPQGRGNITVGQDVPDLIRRTKLVRYDGRPVKLILFTFANESQ